MTLWMAGTADAWVKKPAIAVRKLENAMWADRTATMEVLSNECVVKERLMTAMSSERRLFSI